MNKRLVLVGFALFFALLFALSLTTATYYPSGGNISLTSYSWSNIDPTSFPAACPAGSAITKINTSTTCTAFVPYSGASANVDLNNKSISNVSKFISTTSVAPGAYAIALGSGSNSSGDYSTVVGYQSNAPGNYGIVIGYRSNATGTGSFASGAYSVTSGNFAHSFGGYATTSGAYSMSQGYNVTTSGYSSRAFGYDLIALGNYSTAIGRALTCTQNNATCISHNVGIGTGDPANKLNVIGDGNFTGNLIVQGNTTISQMIKLASITLPSCAAGTDGAIARNATALYFCNSTDWNALY